MLKYADVDTKLVARGAIKLAISENREDENELKDKYLAFKKTPLRSCAVDFGGEFMSSINKIVESAVVAARREGITDERYRIEGAIAGATREACSQIAQKAIGLNVGGKIAIVSSDKDVVVCIFFGIGLLHLDETAIALGHRAI